MDERATDCQPLWGGQAPPLTLEPFRSAYSRWRFTMESFRLAPGQLFQHMELVDSRRAQQARPVITWCPVADLAATRHQLQKSLEQDDFPRALSHILGHNYSWGVALTAPYLWQARHDPELTAAVLLEASLFARMSSSRTEYPQANWPPIAAVGEGRRAIRHLIRERLPGFEDWPHMCTAVLPLLCDDTWYRIEDCSALWRFLGEEHARLYRRFRVLRIDFVERESKRYVSPIPAL